MDKTTTFTGKQLSTLLALSPARISQLADEGIITPIPGTTPRRYALNCVTEYVEFIRGHGDNPDKSKWDPEMIRALNKWAES